MRRALHHIKAKNFLSLKDVSVELHPLNVLVGPNGSGKTNFLKIFDFIGKIAERDLLPAIEDMGGPTGISFLNSQGRNVELSFSGTITNLSHAKALDEYTLSIDLREVFLRSIEGRRSKKSDLVFRKESFTFKRVGGPGRRITIKGDELEIFDRSTKKKLGDEDVSGNTSGLALLRRLGRKYDADQVDEIAELFLSLRLVDIDVQGLRRQARLRHGRYLAADGSNLAEFLLRMREEENDAFYDIESDMRSILPTFEHFVIEEFGGGDTYVRLGIKESVFDEVIPLDRASFGTIRAIALFAMLRDPDPPKLTCIEEIDHGFHPQALDRLIERLREASQRTQIIVATHSPALVNRVEAKELLLFNRSEETGATNVVRPDTGFVREAREKYGYELGELWFAGLLE